MKNILLTLFVISSFLTVNAQVGINTSIPDDGAALQIDSTTGAFVPPRMSTTDMNAIPTPLNGSIIYNTDEDVLYIYKANRWSKNTIPSIPSVVINDNLGGAAMLKGDSTFQNFPAGASAASILENETDFYEVISDGKVRIKNDGIYMISGGISVRDFKAGDNKYILAVFNGSSRLGYMARGFASIPSGTQYWGASGVMTLKFTANDIIDLKYYLSNPGGTDLRGDFVNFSIVKL